jgi:hypothetical protein
MPEMPRKKTRSPWLLENALAAQADTYKTLTADGSYRIRIASRESRGCEPKSGGNVRGPKTTPARSATRGWVGSSSPRKNACSGAPNAATDLGRGPAAPGLGNIPQSILACSIISPMTMSTNPTYVISIVVTIRIVSTVIIVYFFETPPVLLAAP